MGPTWGRQDPGGPHVVPIILAIWEPENTETEQIIPMYRLGLHCLYGLWCPQLYVWERPFTHCGLVMPYGDIDLSTLSQVMAWCRSSEPMLTYHQIRAISKKMPHPSITEISLKITHLKFNSNLTGANEWNIIDHLLTHSPNQSIDQSINQSIINHELCISYRTYILCTVNQELSWFQLYHHWWHWRLSSWQSTPPVMIMLASWQISVFSEYVGILFLPVYS